MLDRLSELEDAVAEQSEEIAKLRRALDGKDQQKALKKLNANVKKLLDRIEVVDEESVD